MNKNDVNWKALAEQLLWNQVVEHKNEGSMFYMIDSDNYKDRGCPRGSIEFALCFQSWIHPDNYHELTWKELCLALETMGHDSLISDGHDCSICPERETCTAFFKDDKDHERCLGWKKEYNKLKNNEDGKS